jgi:hypothetical protein
MAANSTSPGGVGGGKGLIFDSLVGFGGLCRLGGGVGFGSFGGLATLAGFGGGGDEAGGRRTCSIIISNTADNLL